MVVANARMYNPVPHAIPTAAVTHSPAAVVSPLIILRWNIIVPAPRKPIPETICAATREESASPPGKPLTETIVKSALPKATRK